MRTVKQLKNFSSSIFRYLITFFFSFYTRKLFIDALGVEYLGVSGLISNVLGMLAIAELGIGTSIVFSLYKPLAEKDRQKTHLLIALYRKLYHYIALVVLLIGLLLMPFLTDFSPDLANIPHYNIIYLMCLANSVIPYYFAYNSTLYTASQQGYKLEMIHTTFYVITMVITITILSYWPNYILLTACSMLLGIASQIVIYFMARCRWPWLHKKALGTLPDADMRIIKKNVKAMVWHKVGTYCVYGTSSIIIANTINLVTVGLYANYQTVISSLTRFLHQFFTSSNSGLGNLIALESKEKVYNVFRELNFIAFWWYGLLTIGVFFSIDLLIEIWLGSEYQISRWAIVYISLNIYVVGMRMSCASFKSASGLFSADQYVPILQSILNLTLGFILGTMYGLPGITFSTLASGLLTISWYGAYVIYRDFLKISVIKYYLDYLIYVIFILFVGGVVFMIKKNYEPSNTMVNFLYTVLLVLGVYHIALFVFHSSIPGGKLVIARILTFWPFYIKKKTK